MIFNIKKYLSICLLIFICNNNTYGNEIDVLKTKEDVFKFLATQVADNGRINLHGSGAISRKQIAGYDTMPLYESIPVETLDTIINRFPFHFYIADIDGNGYSDLIIEAGRIYIVMDLGGTFEGHLFDDYSTFAYKSVISLQDGTKTLLLRHDYNPRPQHIDLRLRDITYITACSLDKITFPQKNIIDTLKILYHFVDSQTLLPSGEILPEPVVKIFTDTADFKLYNRVDTFIYKFGGFELYHPKIKIIDISKIDYYYCVSTDLANFNGYDCIEINKNGQCFMNYLCKGAFFSGVIDSGLLNDLWGLISYVDIKSKKDRYEIEVDHAAGSAFAIFFADGTKKKIETWGCAPMDLTNISKKISQISETLLWKKADKPKGFECPCVLPQLDVLSNYSCDR